MITVSFVIHSPAAWLIITTPVVDSDFRVRDLCIGDSHVDEVLLRLQLPGHGDGAADRETKAQNDASEGGIDAAALVQAVKDGIFARVGLSTHDLKILRTPHHIRDAEKAENAKFVLRL